MLKKYKHLSCFARAWSAAPLLELVLLLHVATLASDVALIIGSVLLLLLLLLREAKTKTIA
jgi:hypothetical protein